MDDISPDVRWMSYGELAEARGISKASAQRLVMRRRWPRRKGNDGSVRVAIPTGQDAPQADIRPDVGPDITQAISALETAVTTLKTQLEIANDRAATAEARTAAVEADAAAWWARSRWWRVRKAWRGRG